MEPSHLLPLLLALLPALLLVTLSHATTGSLPACLVSNGLSNFTMSSPTPSMSYDLLLNFSIQNLRFAGSDVPKPAAIVFPGTRDELRAAVLCLRQADLAIRLRSGGHSYEGLSYTAEPHVPFAVIDLMNLNKVRVNPASATAWAESGATLGEVYLAVAESSRSLAFSAGSCSTMGVGGHISGGGFGLLSRKYGLSADNVLDAVLIDSSGRVLDRESMGEDVFWAIRGGGGGSWGAVYAWKLRLVPVPERVTVFTPSRSGPTPTIAALVHKWQQVAPSLPDEFYLSVYIAGSGHGNVSASFTGMVLRPKSSAISTLSQRFPELNLQESDLSEVTWIDSVARFAGLDSVSDLTSRDLHRKTFYKAKSDYVRAPIAERDLISALDFLGNKSEAYIILDPYGGAMGRIPSDYLPFPHRAGNLYGIQYMIDWTKAADVKREEYVAWMRSFHAHMGPLVSSNPRAAYVNYVDLDLGTNDGSEGQDVVQVARVWAQRYFLGNYDRLVKAKTIVDPNNTFHNQQSIPPIPK